VTAPRLGAEICVLGGGPAGAAAALKLTRLGHEVLVVERERFPRPHVGESLAPGIWRQLDLLGLAETVRGGGFLPASLALVRWAGSTEAVPSPTPGLLVDRGRFDEILLAAAREAGARVLQPARALRPRRTASGWVVPVIGERGVLEVEARWLVDATGRASRLGGRPVRTTPSTVALHASWRRPPGAWLEPRVEAAPDAWLWGAPLPDGTFSAMVFLDAERYRGWRRSGKSRESLYLEALGRSVLLRELPAAKPPERVQACDATCRHDPEPIGEGFIKLGEAAFAIDPLSSSGVQVALRTAWSGSIAAHTILTQPHDANAARQFYRESQECSVRQHVAWAAAYHAQAGGSAEPFRQQRDGLEAGFGPWEPDRLVRLSAAARLVDAPCIAGDLIETRRALCHPRLERPVAYLNDVELVPLLEAIPEGAHLGRLAAAWSGRVPMHQAFEVALWLIRQGILVPAA
jgi:flavin-dependent dehydrogenase